MIKSLKIKNFQSHSDTFLEFSEGINVISGESNQGKTAILRALNWVINNKPSGIAFKSSFSDKKDLCEVSININGKKITRKKNVTVNSYEISNSEPEIGIPTILDTIGNNLPSEVSSIINMSDINTQSQFDNHFLLMSSAGEVGRTINKIVNLDIIDELVSNLNSKVLSTNRDVELRKQDLDKMYVSLEKFKDLDFIEKSVIEITGYDKNIVDNTNITFALDHLLSELEKTDVIIEKTENSFLELEYDVNKLEEIWVNCSVKLNIIKDLKNIIANTKNCDILIEGSEKVVNNEVLISELEELSSKYRSKNENYSELKQLIEKWNSISLKIYEDSVEEIEEEFNKFILDNGCPTCGRKGKL